LGLPVSLACCSGAGLALCALPLGLLTLDLLDPYRWPPSPDGLVLRVPIGAVEFPERHVAVVPAPGGRAALRVRSWYSDGRAGEVFEVDYPSGRVRPVTPGEGAPLSWATPQLDLDGDGVADGLRIGPDLFERTVEVVSGASGVVLFRDRDRFEYARKERAFPLGDLDGDGFGELALVHPREDRSTYDIEPLDSLLGVHGWVTVISGSRL
jgi:hypothetical protein